MHKVTTRVSLLDFFNPLLSLKGAVLGFERILEIVTKKMILAKKYASYKKSTILTQFE